MKRPTERLIRMRDRLQQNEWPVPVDVTAELEARGIIDEPAHTDDAEDSE